METLRQTLSVNPATVLPEDGSARDWYSFRRSSPEAEIVWLYNDANEQDNATIRFADVAGYTPYSLDARTGDAAGVVHYLEEGNDILIPLSLHINETFIVAFVPRTGCRRTDSILGPRLRTHVTSASGSVIDFAYSHDTRSPQVHVKFTEGPVDIAFANQETIHLEGPQTPPATNLEFWDLEIEDWHASDDAASVETRIDVFTLNHTRLAPWNTLDSAALTNVSGIGTYTTEFNSPSELDFELGARLHLGYMRDSAKVWLNGEAVYFSDNHGGEDTIVDLTQFLSRPANGSSASNALRVEVGTTLLNQVKADASDIQSMGSWATSLQVYDAIPSRDYGLQGTVWIEWFNVARIL